MNSVKITLKNGRTIQVATGHDFHGNKRVIPVVPIEGLPWLLTDDCEPGEMDRLMKAIPEATGEFDDEECFYDSAVQTATKSYEA